MHLDRCKKRFTNIDDICISHMSLWCRRWPFQLWSVYWFLDSSRSLKCYFSRTCSHTFPSTPPDSPVTYMHGGNVAYSGQLIHQPSTQGKINTITEETGKLHTDSNVGKIKTIADMRQQHYHCIAWNWEVVTMKKDWMCQNFSLL